MAENHSQAVLQEEQLTVVTASGQPTGQPAVDHRDSARTEEWGRVQLRIYNPFRDGTVLGGAAEVGIGIAAFYFNQVDLVRKAIRRAVERRDPDNPDQPADPEVGLEVQVGSLLVPVIFHSRLGYDYFSSIQNGPFLKACLKVELEKVGYKEPVDVSVERWEVPAVSEGRLAAGLVMGTTRQHTAENDMSEVMSPQKKLQETLHTTPGPEENLGAPVSDLAGLSIFTSDEDHQGRKEDDTPPGKGRPNQKRPQISLAARLQRHRNSPTAKAMLQAYSCLERGAAMLVNDGYQRGEGVRHLLEGLVLMEEVLPGDVETVLYGQHWLNLDKAKLDRLISTELEDSANNTPCLLLQALQLPTGDRRLRAINHVIDVVLQLGKKDALYNDIAYIYFALCSTLWTSTKQAAPTLSACASALMHRPSHLSTLFYTARSSMTVSVPQAIRQLEHFIRTAPPCHHQVPRAHYYLVRLYGQQGVSTHWDKILHHYSTAQQTESDRLPVFGQVPSMYKDQARKVYDKVVAGADK
ncbi:Hypp5880 [Branchiostoma lanceolatum]|uniref:Hypp5880 protein n=1 Tax=Branchiostoma lanceolatum TaxID=7740 RepID=A0A8J9VGA7_BRALA|nr:Hypp5880 [Branchiostoma lanceolatum]